MFRSRKTLPAVLAGALALAGCATTPATQVTRFHLGQPIARGQIAVEPLLPEDRGSLEAQSYASIIGAELARVGFSEAPGLAASEQVAVFSVERSYRPGPPRGSSFSIGLGGGTFGRGGGFGGGVSVPVAGNRRPSEIPVTRLVVQIKRRSEGTVIWEGRAETVGKPGASGDMPATVRRLAAAMFTGFPGDSGRTITVQ